jgi:hypothetical protein
MSAGACSATPTPPSARRAEEEQRHAPASRGLAGARLGPEHRRMPTRSTVHPTPRRRPTCCGACVGLHGSRPRNLGSTRHRPARSRMARDSPGHLRRLRQVGHRSGSEPLCSLRPSARTDRLRTCVAGANGCRSWSSPVVCPEGFGASACACGTCAHTSPAVGATECTDGRLRTCIADVNGCRSWSAARRPYSVLGKKTVGG